MIRKIGFTKPLYNGISLICPYAYRKVLFFITLLEKAFHDPANKSQNASRKSEAAVILINLWLLIS